MDGAFYRDLVVNLPITHARVWATNYYLHYPAIVVLLYPPVFSVVEAVFFLLFGVSHFSAQLTVAAFYMAAAVGAYQLACVWVNRASALAVSLLFIGAHEIARWGRQVMLEIPVYALILWSCYFLFVYLRDKKEVSLYLAAIALSGALYTKQTVLFLPLVFAVTIYAAQGWEVLHDRAVRRATGGFLLLTLPLLLFTLRFSGTHLKTVSGGEPSGYTRLNLAGWLFYVQSLPQQVGWAILSLASVYVLVGFVRHQWKLSKPAIVFLTAWLGFGYVFFSLLQVHEPRHSSVILFPLTIFVVLAIHHFIPPRFASYTAIALSSILLAFTLLYDPVPHLDGYEAVTDYVATVAPANSVILFSGYQDGMFIFDLRARDGAKNFAVLRSDKLLLNYAVYREWGLKQVSVTEPQIANLLNRYGVQYIVDQPNFWQDLKNMQSLQNVLHTAQFEKVADFPITGNILHHDTHIEIYKNLSALQPHPEQLKLNLGSVDLSVEGKIGETGSH